MNNGKQCEKAAISIRKYKPDEIERKLIEEIIYSASLAPSAKNRQPWKFIVYQGEEKDKLVDVMRHGINSEKATHELMPEWAGIVMNLYEATILTYTYICTIGYRSCYDEGKRCAETLCMDYYRQHGVWVVWPLPLVRWWMMPLWMWKMYGSTWCGCRRYFYSFCNG